MTTLQLNTYKNVEGGTVGRILSYYDLCDLPYGYNQADKDLDFSEFMTEEEVEEAEGRRQEREDMIKAGVKPKAPSLTKI